MRAQVSQRKIVPEDLDEFPALMRVARRHQESDRIGHKPGKQENLRREEPPASFLKFLLSCVPDSPTFSSLHERTPQTVSL
jgi:hypothetical protein